MACGKFLCLALAALLLLASCDHGEFPPNNGMVVDTTWSGDTLIHF